MRKFIIAIAAGVLFSWTVSSFAEISCLSYRVSTRIDREVGSVSGGGERLSAKRPDNMAEPPALVAEKPFYGRAMGRRLVILDKSSKDARAHDVLWLDANNDGKFDPKERFVLAADEEGQGGSAVIAIEMPDDDGPVVQHYGLSAAARGDDAYVSYKSVGYYFGKVKFGDKSHLVALVDYNANGVFNDPSAKDKDGDRILVDYNDNGRFENNYQREEELACVGKYLYVDGIYWGTSVAADGSSIDVMRLNVATGKLQTDEARLMLTVVGENGKFTLRREKATEPFALPAGSYFVQVAEAVRKGKDGADWSVRSSPGAGPAFEITADKEATIKVGAPFVASVSADKQGDGVNCDFSLTGVDGLSYQLQKNGSQLELAPPQLLVKAKEGNWQRRYAFAFG